MIFITNNYKKYNILSKLSKMILYINLHNLYILSFYLAACPWAKSFNKCDIK